MKRLVIDPGDEHVGWVLGGNSVIEVGEWRPTEACDAIVHLLTHRKVDEIVLEDFVLYDREYSNQTWSSLKTPQLIGAIKLIAHWFRIPVVLQGAHIKKPTRAKMKRLGIIHLGQSIHERDAELHYYYRKLRSGSG